MKMLKHKKTVIEFGQVLFTFLVIVSVVMLGFFIQAQHSNEVIEYCDNLYGQGNWIFNTSYQGMTQINNCINVSIPKYNFTCECDC